MVSMERFSDVVFVERIYLNIFSTNIFAKKYFLRIFLQYFFSKSIMPSNKKKRNKKKVKVIIPYTKEERFQKVEAIKTKLAELGLLHYDEDMINIQKKMDHFVETGEKYKDHVKLMGTKRIIHVSMTNNKNKAINVLLTYDKDV